MPIPPPCSIDTIDRAADNQKARMFDAMLLCRRFARSAVLAGALGAAFALPAGAAANKSHIAVKGPSSVKVGSAYSFTVSGMAYSPGNFVSLRESSVRCASSYNSEYPISASTHNSRYVKSGQRFSFKIRLTPNIPGTGYLCAYVINYKTIKTYAHGGTRVTVHGV